MNDGQLKPDGIFPFNFEIALLTQNPFNSAVVNVDVSILQRHSKISKNYYRLEQQKRRAAEARRVCSLKPRDCSAQAISI